MGVCLCIGSIGWVVGTIHNDVGSIAYQRWLGVVWWLLLLVLLVKHIIIVGNKNGCLIGCRWCWKCVVVALAWRATVNGGIDCCVSYNPFISIQWKYYCCWYWMIMGSFCFAFCLVVGGRWGVGSVVEGGWLLCYVVSLSCLLSFQYDEDNQIESFRCFVRKNCGQ